MNEGTGSQARTRSQWGLDAVAFAHLVLVLIMVGMLVQTFRIMANAEITTGVVESKRVIKGGEEPDTLELRYTFRAASGVNYRGSASVTQEIYERTSVGAKVEVQYAADDPGNNRVISETGTPRNVEFAVMTVLASGVFLYFGPRRWLALRRGEPDPVLT